ncbi:MAG: hypothetical protein AB1635_14770 [Acidobacteriota bacterium]
MHAGIRPALLGAVLATLAGGVIAQEKPVPRDSVRLSVAGCARGRVFTVDRDPDHETRGVELAMGRKLRLAGPRPVLDEIKANERSMVELTGLMKQADVRPPGISLGGGRVRIAPGGPVAGGNRPQVPEVSVFDVESWRLLNASCPDR